MTIEKILDDCANTIRQQAQEIAMLKQIIDANNLSQNIGQFVKPIDEPVAWMSNAKEFYVQKNYCPDFIPLYTHPMRELTEDEIREVADSVCHTWKKNGVGELYMTDFARAILRKASDK